MRLRLAPKRRPGYAACLGLALLGAASFALPSLRADEGFPDEAAGEQACPPAPVQRLKLPHLRRALAENQEIVIVAIGSSSTHGHMSSNIGRSYPAVLQDLLNRDLPRGHVAVLNRGIDGQDAAEEVPRLQSDVLAAWPQLVIWQVGANGVLRDTDPEVFKRLVGAGIRLLQAAHIDVILMDNQRTPKILMVPGHAAMDEALAAAAAGNGASLFSRGTLMDAWQQAGEPYEAFTSPDGLHHNDRGYRCVAEALAASIVKAVQAPEAKTSSANP